MIIVRSEDRKIMQVRKSARYTTLVRLSVNSVNSRGDDNELLIFVSKSQVNRVTLRVSLITIT